MLLSSPALQAETAIAPTPILIVSLNPAPVREIVAASRIRHPFLHTITTAEEAVLAIRQATGPTILLLEDTFLEQAPAEFVAALLSENLRRLWTILLESGGPREPAIHACHDRMPIPFTQEQLEARLLTAQSALRLMRRLAQQHHATLFHAEHDSLTGLWNRETILQHLHSETDRSQRQDSPLALVLIDLDHFSAVNVEYGYEVGDRVLQELAVRFRGFLRSYDLVGRYGEDEFLFALPHTTSLEAATFTNRLRRLLFTRPYSFGRAEFALRASVGISHSVGRSPLIVLREAERALAAAKACGRDRQRIHSELEPAGAVNAGARLSLVLPPEAGR